MRAEGGGEVSNRKSPTHAKQRKREFLMRKGGLLKIDVWCVPIVFEFNVRG